jgi:hypothetical protein
MAAKNIILQMKLENAIVDLMVRAGADNVIVDSGSNETLATRLATIAAQITALQEGSGGASDAGLDQEAVQGLIDTSIAALIDSAPETYATLKEIADYIASDKSAMETLNTAIGKKVDKVSGKQLSTEDFTTTLKNKLDAIAAEATKVEHSDTNGNIKINGSETTVYTHPSGAGNTHLPSGGTTGQVLRAAGSGAGTWGANVRSGVSEPGDLAEGELFIKIIEE